MRKLAFPDALVLIFGMIVVIQLLSYLIPQGEYEREGRKLIKGTYQELPEGEAERKAWELAEVEKFDQKRREVATKLADPQTTADEATELVASLAAGPRKLPPPRVSAVAFITSVPETMKEAETAEVIFFILLIGGAIAVMRASGAVDAFLGIAIKRLGHRPLYLVAGMTTIFAIGSSSIGMAEEYLPFLPLLVTLSLALGMDAMVAMGIICIGYSVGYGAAVMNPFTVVVAQNIAGLEPTSGSVYRLIVMVVCLAVGIHHLLRYAQRVRNDPSKSLVADIDYSGSFEAHKETPMTGRRAGVLVLFAVAIGFVVWGVKFRDWYLVELSSIFIAFAIVGGIVGGLSPNRIAREFTTGAAELAGTAIIIGFAKTIKTVMDGATITDTIVHWIETGLSGFSASVTAVAMLFVQSCTNFLIPSGSGQAYVTMPIMKDIAALSGVTQQTAVLAYQMGDGFTNIIIPTNAVVMGMLAMVKIPFQRWFRFLLPFFLKIYIVSAIALVIAVLMDYGINDVKV